MGTAKLCEYCGTRFEDKYEARPQIYCNYHCKNNAAQRRYMKRLQKAYKIVKETVQ